jgi:hypothetical protein
MRMNLERISLGIMTAGILMLVQPFWLWAFTWSVGVILIGTAAFIVTSHLRVGELERPPSHFRE